MNSKGAQLTDAEIDRIHELRKKGESLRAIGRIIGYSQEGVRQVLLRTGGDPAPIKESAIGRRVGILTILTEPTGRREGARVLCRCDCGNEKLIRWDNLLSMNVKSCGCLHAKAMREAIRTRGMIFGRSLHLLTHEGKTQSIMDWTRETGLKNVTIPARLRHGWSVKTALTTPVYGRYGGQEENAGHRAVMRKSKLTEWGAVGCLAEVLMGATCQQVATRREISRGTVESVWYGRSWRDLFEWEKE